tara:strand:- start:1654 stop:3597 length:1944 start_codon:yes stop_codon:yes gene_type:complete
MNEEYILKIRLEDEEFIVSVNGVETKVGKLGQAFDVGKQKAKGLSDATEDLGKKNQDLISNAGLAGATLTELGRTVSDLPYGIRGVANNLSQLSTLFITLVAKSSDGGKSIDGVKNAFGLLINQLKGPLGFILAFQAVIALLDFFSSKTKKAKKDTKEFTSELKKQNETLRDQIKINQQNLENVTKITDLYTYEFSRALKDSTMFAKQNAGALAEISERLEEVGVKGAAELKNQDIAIENRIFAAGKLGEILEKQIEIDKIRVQQNTALEKGDEARARELGIQLANLQNEKTLLQDQFDRLVEINEIVIEIGDNKNKNKDKTKEETEEIEAQIISFKEFLALQKQGTNIELANIELTKEKEITALKLRGLSRSEFEKEKDKIIKNALQEELKVLTVLLDANKVFGAERIAVEKQVSKIIGELFDKTSDNLKNTFSEDLQEISAMLGEVERVTNMFTDAELSREERKTTILNNELRERLRNENLSKEERIRINKEIEDNELKLQKKRDEIAERNFKLQKAFAIAQATINTALAISDVLAREKTGFIGKTLAAIAIGALGAAQIAAIASTKFVPTATSVPGGVGSVGAGGSGGGAQDPAFNIVGTGQQFQLAQVIAQRTGEPIRAFVVSGDVRTGLALDRNIINSSKIN